MVERLNRSLLQLLRVYVTDEADWEMHLPLALYALCHGHVVKSVAFAVISSGYRSQSTRCGSDVTSLTDRQTDGQIHTYPG